MNDLNQWLPNIWGESITIIIQTPTSFYVTSYTFQLFLVHLISLQGQFNFFNWSGLWIFLSFSPQHGILHAGLEVCHWERTGFERAVLLKLFPSVNTCTISTSLQTIEGLQTVFSIACRVHISSVILLLTHPQLINLHYLTILEQLRKVSSDWHILKSYPWQTKIFRAQTCSLRPNHQRKVTKHRLQCFTLALLNWRLRVKSPGIFIFSQHSNCLESLIWHCQNWNQYITSTTKLDNFVLAY